MALSLAAGEWDTFAMVDILAAAAEFDADVIVVGRRGWPFAEGPGRMVTGYLLRHSDRPVLVVAPWAQSAASDSPGGTPAVS